MDKSLSFNLDANYLIVSLIWSGIGGGFWIYGKKQRSAPPMFGGMVMIAVTFLITSWLWMTLACIGIIFGIYIWSKNSD